MLILHVPDNLLPERRYVADVVFRQFLGIDVAVHVSDRQGVQLTGQDHSRLELPDAFFRRTASTWLASGPGTRLPIAQWNTRELERAPDVLDDEIPILFGEGGLSVSGRAGARVVRLPLDIFGSVFFMLTRYEEAVNAARDEHGRFPATASLAQQANFLRRPIVDEYVEILWAVLHSIWPSLVRRNWGFRQVISCDVDAPFDLSVRSVKTTVRRVLGDLFKRRRLTMAWDTLHYATEVKRLGVSADRAWRFEWMMDACERAGTRCAFNFITDARHQNDGPGYWGRPEIDVLMREVASRGHEVGLHASYSSVGDADRTKREFERLKSTSERLGINQETWGGRQHYLRWDVRRTWRDWASAGLDYDSTLSFAESPGFRCGTCRPFPVFDLIERRRLSLVERPLIVMEVSALSPSYLGLDRSQAAETIKGLKNVCRRYGGEFTLLWHNTSLLSDADRELYEHVLVS